MLPHQINSLLDILPLHLHFHFLLHPLPNVIAVLLSLCWCTFSYSAQKLDALVKTELVGNFLSTVLGVKTDKQVTHVPIIPPSAIFSIADSCLSLVLACADCL